MSGRRWSAAVACTALVLASCQQGRPLPDLDPGAAAAGVTAPSAGDVLVEGGWPEVAAFVASAAAEDRPSVVNLFGSWCEPCAVELPLLLAVSDETPDVAWLGVAVQDVQRNAAVFVEEQEVGWPTVLDLDATTYDALAGIGMPTTAFFDREGRLVTVVDGIIDEQRLDDALAAIGA